MAVNTRSNFILPEILEDAVSGAMESVKALLGTGAAIVRPGLPAGSQQGGDEVTMPYFEPFGKLDEIVNEGDSLSPVDLKMTDEKAKVRHSGKLFSITTWAAMAAAYADPYGEAGKQIAVATEEMADDALVEAATKNLPGSMTIDRWSASVPVYLDSDFVVDAKLKWGDKQKNIAAIIIHSAVYARLLKQKDSTGKLLLTDVGEGMIPRFMGIPVVVSDAVGVDMTDPDHPKYTTLVVKRGALVFWYAKKPSVDDDKNIANDSKLVAVHVYWAVHRYKRLSGDARGGVVALKHN